MKFKRSRFAFILLTSILFYTQAFAQRYYFDDPATNNILTDNPDLASDGDLSTAATLFITPAWIKLNNAQTIPAGVTTFIRVDVPGMTPDNFQTLLTVTPYSGTKTAAILTIRVITQFPNATYIAVTPSAPYNSVRINYLSGTWWGSKPMKVYDAFTGNDPADCGGGWATSYSTSSSISSVSSPANAVDADPNSYSIIKVQTDKDNVITVSQTIYFSNAGTSNDLVRIYLSEEGSFNKKALKPTGAVQAFLNETPVGPIRSDLLTGIIQAGVAVPIDLEPGGAFNRVTITVSLPSSGADKIYELSVREAQILPRQPVLSLSSPEFCADAEDVISISSPVSGLQYKWYEGTIQLPNSLPDSYLPTKLPVGQHILSVTASKPGCPESSPATVTINVNPKPVQPKINPF